MSRERFTAAALVAALLVAGLLTGRQFPLSTSEAQEAESAARSFREWFWESRALDMVAQVGLIFAGALGIAALLPRENEVDDA